jgi:hypothetical protein
MKKALTGLGSVLIGAFAGYALFAWGIPAFAGGGGAADAGPGIGRGLSLLLLPTAALGMLGVLATHELGHVAGGRLAGLRFLLLIVGPLKVVRGAEGGLDFSLNRSLSLAGGLAACGPNPDDLTDLRRRMTWLVAGGPVASLLLGVVALAIHQFAFEPPLSPFSTFLESWVLIVALASLGIFLVTLVPARTGGFATDGAQLIQLLRGGPEADGRIAMASIVAWSMGGVPPRDWAPEVLSAATESSDEGVRAIGLHSAWRHSLDHASPEWSPDALRVRLLDEIEGIPESVRGGVLLEMAVDRALAGQVEEARHLIERAATPGGLVDAHVLPMARAAVAWAEGRGAEASALLDQAEGALGSSLDGAAKLLDGGRIRQLRARIKVEPGESH